jgi:tetratricopeptide (TPR) repeat protein
MIKKLSLVSLLTLAACSSPVILPADIKPEMTNSAADEKETPSVFAASETKEVTLVPEVTTASSYAALNEALKQQNNEAIQKAASVLLIQNPKDLKALNALAMVYYKKSRFEAASYLLNKAITNYPDSSMAYGNKGLVQLAQNERHDAIKSFRKAIEVNPQDGFAGANLGAIYVHEKDYSKGVLALEIAVKNNVNDFKVMNNYAIALAGTRKIKEASEIYEKLLKENPNQKDVMLNYSILLIEEMQKYREGLDLLNRLKFVGSASESRQVIKELEIKAKAGLK